MTKYIALGLTTFFLWCLSTLTQNSVRNLSELGYVEQAGELITPMWLFMIAFAISLITLLAIAIADLNKAGN